MIVSKCNCVYEEFCSMINGKDIVLPQPCEYRKDSTDFVTVVRCKDCKHLRVINGKDLYAFCLKTEYKFMPFQTDTRTHFCSLGERKDD